MLNAKSEKKKTLGAFEASKFQPKYCVGPTSLMHSLLHLFYLHSENF